MAPESIETIFFLVANLSDKAQVQVQGLGAQLINKYHSLCAPEKKNELISTGIYIYIYMYL